MSPFLPAIISNTFLNLETVLSSLTEKIKRGSSSSIINITEWAVQLLAKLTHMDLARTQNQEHVLTHAHKPADINIHVHIFAQNTPHIHARTNNYHVIDIRARMHTRADTHTSTLYHTSTYKRQKHILGSSEASDLFCIFAPKRIFSPRDNFFDFQLFVKVLSYS